jgi:hypothetical protein
MEFRLNKPALAGTVPKNHILQLAFAAFVAYGAVERMIGQQELQRPFPRLAYLRWVRMHNHAFRDGQRARYLKLRDLLDLDKAHPAGSLKRQAVVITKCRNFDSGLLCSID